jgi:hypothetical protein
MKEIKNSGYKQDGQSNTNVGKRQCEQPKGKTIPCDISSFDSSVAEDSIVMGRYDVSCGNTSRYGVTPQKT